MKSAALSLLLLAASLCSAQLRTAVQYVSNTAVYLAAGRDAGVTVGDSVQIIRTGKEWILLTVDFVSDNSSSCALTDAASVVAVGDSAMILTKKVVLEPGVLELPAETPLSSDPAEPSVQPSRTGRANQLSGRVNVGYALQDDRELTAYDYTEPTFGMRASLNRISGSEVNARVNLRLRRTNRSDDNRSFSSNRIYEALLAYEPKEKPFHAGLGRLLLRETRGFGYLDGVYMKYALNRTWTFGLLGGIEPDLQNTRIQSDVTKLGAFASFERHSRGVHAVQATASLAGRYLDGEISREFLYQQLNYSYGSKLRLFESTELNLNRGWLNDAEGSSLTLASLLLDAHYRISRLLGVSVGYDNRTNYYTAETRSIPDSIFASSLQQGLRAGVDTRFGDSYSADIGIAQRGGDGDFSSSSSGWFRIGSSKLLKSSFAVFARVRWFDSDFSKGTQPAVSLSRELAHWLTTQLELGSNDYEIGEPAERVSQQWVSVGLDARLSKPLLAAAEFEQGFGDGRDISFLSLLLGYRF